MTDVRRKAGWLADKLAEQDRRLNQLASRKPGLAQSSIEDGAIDEYTADGTFASSVGKQPDGSHVAFPATGPKPATPVKATLKSTPGLVEVRWSGKFEGGDVSTLDFKHVAVHASTTPDVDTSPATQLATIRGELGDVASIVAEEGMLYVVLVAWTAAGKASEPSQVAAVAVAAPANATLIQDAIDDHDTKYDGVATEANDLAVRMTTAEQDLYVHEGRLNDADTQLDDAFGQLGTVDSRVAAAKQEAIDAGQTYTDEQAQQAVFEAISAQAFSRNPSFDDWTGALPVGFTAYGTGPTKETAITRRGAYAARFNCTDATTSRGLNLGGGALYDLPTGQEYWTVEISFQVVSGTSLNGAGILLDWVGMTGGNRATLSLAAEVPNPVAGKWYTVVKTLQRPAGATGTNTGMAGYLMANFSASYLGGSMAIKDIVVDWINVRPATAEEINAGKALTMAGSKSRVYYNTGVATGEATAYGDLWRQVDAQNNIIAEWRWSGTAWVQTAISSQAISNLDLGKLTAGSATMLQATIDKLVAATAAFQTVDVGNLFVSDAAMKQAVIDKLWADVVHAYKITTEMLLVSAGSNLFVDPDIQDTGNWASGYASTTGGKNGKGSVLIPMSSTQSGSYYGIGLAAPKVGMRLVPGSTYRVGAWVRAAVDIPVAAVKIYMRLYNDAGSNTAFGADVTGAVPQNQAIIPANTWGWVEGMVQVPADSTGNYGVLGLYKQASFTTSAVRWSDPQVQSAVDAQLVVNGQIKAKALEALLVLASEIIAGNPNGTHAKMTPTGFKVLAAQMDGSTPKEVLRLGTDTDDYFAVTNAQNEQVAAITSLGDMSVQTLSVNDPAGLTMGGTSLLDLTDTGGNLMGWASRATDGKYWAGTNPHPFLSLQVDGIRAGRAYMVSTTPIGVTSDAASSDAVVNLHYVAGVDRPATTSDPIINAATSVPAGWSTGKRNPVTFNRLLTPSTDGTCSLLISYGVESTGRSRIQTSGGRPVILTVTDLGPRLPETGEYRDGTADAPASGSTGGETTAPTTSKKNYDQTWNATGLRSFLGSGGTYAYNTGYMYSGLSPAGYGDLSSMAVFPSLTTLLSGATVTGVWVYVYYDFWYQGSGGAAYIGLHGQTGLTSTAPAKTYSHALSSSWPRAAGRWVKMSSSTYAGWASGQHRGFTLGGSGGGYERYGYAHNPRLRITWTK